MKNIYLKFAILSSLAAILVFTACSNEFDISYPRIPEIFYFAADPDVIMKGDTTRLIWLVEEGNFSGVEITVYNMNNLSAIGTGFDIIDSVFVSPDTTTTYRLIARNGAGHDSALTFIEVR